MDGTPIAKKWNITQLKLYYCRHMYLNYTWFDSFSGICRSSIPSSIGMSPSAWWQVHGELISLTPYHSLFVKDDHWCNIYITLSFPRTIPVIWFSFPEIYKQSFPNSITPFCQTIIFPLSINKLWSLFVLCSKFMSFFFGDEWNTSITWEKHKLWKLCIIASLKNSK